MNPARLHAMMSGQDRSPAGRLFRAATACAEPFYRAAVAARNAMFDHGLRKPKRLPRPVISVGNLTTGGTGKTPMVIEMARRLVAMGAKPAVLLRGYAGEATVNERKRRISDESRLLANELTPAVPVEVNPDRAKAAQFVLAYRSDIDVFLLDDGFQHRQVRRDMDIVLIDATQPFGFGHVLPRGMLRESVAALGRANATMVTRSDRVEPSWLSELAKIIERHAGKPPIALTATRWSNLRDENDAAVPLGKIHDQKVLGLCGIANPGQFIEQLKGMAGPKSEWLTLPDHYHYSGTDYKIIMDRAHENDFDCVVTTEKDWVKLKGPIAAGPVPPSVPIYRPVLRVEFLEGGGAVDAMLRACLAKAPPHPAP
jgi:tetraacyldisaccharide 4'-kinase